MLDVSTADKTLQKTLFDYAASLVGDFWQIVDSTVFSPYTIAFTAFILTFTKFKLDISDSIKRFPTDCFNTHAHENSSTLPERAAFDVNLCLSCFEKAVLCTNPVKTTLFDAVKENVDGLGEFSSNRNCDSPSGIDEFPEIQLDK